MIKPWAPCYVSIFHNMSSFIGFCLEEDANILQFPLSFISTKFFIIQMK